MLGSNSLRSAGICVTNIVSLCSSCSQHTERSTSDCPSQCSALGQNPPNASLPSTMSCFSEGVAAGGEVRCSHDLRKCAQHAPELFYERDAAMLTSALSVSYNCAFHCYCFVGNAWDETNRPLADSGCWRLVLFCFDNFLLDNFFGTVISSGAAAKRSMRLPFC